MLATPGLCDRCGEYALQLHRYESSLVCLRCRILLRDKRQKREQPRCYVCHRPLIQNRYTDAWLCAFCGLVYHDDIKEETMEIPHGCTWRFLWAWWLYGKKQPDARNRVILR